MSQLRSVKRTPRSGVAVRRHARPCPSLALWRTVVFGTCRCWRLAGVRRGTLANLAFYAPEYKIQGLPSPKADSTERWPSVNRARSLCHLGAQHAGINLPREARINSSRHTPHAPREIGLHACDTAGYSRTDHCLSHTSQHVCCAIERGTPATPAYVAATSPSLAA